MLKRLIGAIALAISLVASCSAATLLPNGEQTFLDANGQPLSSGKVYFYIPNTLTAKATYQNSSQSVSNTNPVTLDVAGRAVIYGSGQYREIVTDVNGNLIWDQLTTDTSATTYSWAGTSGGTTNNQTLTAPNFTLGDGQQIGFIAGLANSGAFTVTVNSGTPVNVVKATSGGPISLGAGDIVTGNQYELTYSASNGNFQIGSLPTQSILTTQPLASAATTDLGSILSHNVTVTGSTTITSFGSSATTTSQYYFLTFSGSPLITAGTSIKTLSGGNIQASPGSTAFLAYIGSGQWQFINYSAGVANVSQPQGRLTLSSGVSVLSSAVSAATSVLYTPYIGNQIPIWNGVFFAPTPFTETTQALSDTTLSPAAAVASSVYDLFAWNSGGAIVVTRGPAWSNATTRGYSLSRVNGLLVNTSSITNGPGAGYGTYIGTIATDASGGTVTYNPLPAAASGGPTNGAWVGLWNAYNSVPVSTIVQDSKASWPYTTSTWRSSDSSNNNRVSFVTGQSTDYITATFLDSGYTGAISGAGVLGMGLDSTSTNYSSIGNITSDGGALVTSSAFYTVNNITGFHYIQALEWASGVGANFYGSQTPGQYHQLTVNMRF